MSAEIQLDSKDLMVIGKNDIISGLELPTDVYVKLPSDRYVMVAKKGSKSSLHDLHASENNENLIFFIRKVEFAHCVEQNIRIAGILSKKNNIALERRAEFLKFSMDSVYKQMDELGFQPRLLEHSKAIVGNMISMIVCKNDYLKLVNGIRELPGNLVRVGVAGSALSVLVGKQLGWPVPSLEKLGVGAMLRDIGLKKVPLSILEKKRSEMNASERNIWETHPQLGADILKTISGVPPDVVTIVLEHHENSMGLGFPRKLRDFAMSPLSKVVSLVDAFVELTLPIEENIQPMTPEEAAHHLEMVIGLPYNRSCMIALRKAMEWE